MAAHLARPKGPTPGGLSRVAERPAHSPLGRGGGASGAPVARVVAGRTRWCGRYQWAKVSPMVVLVGVGAVCGGLAAAAEGGAVGRDGAGELRRVWSMGEVGKGSGRARWC